MRAYERDILVCSVITQAEWQKSVMVGMLLLFAVIVLRRSFPSKSKLQKSRGSKVSSSFSILGNFLDKERDTDAY